MRLKLVPMLVAAMALIPAVPTSAAEQQVTGTIVATQGHQGPACRMVQLRLSNGQFMWFRIPAVANNDDGIMAVTLTALVSGKTVAIDYDPAVTTGCGTEPKIVWIEIRAAP